MKVTHIPIKEIKIYEIVKIPTSLFSKYCSATQIDWCDGFMLSYDEIDSKIKSKELIKSQTFHILRVVYCVMTQFPKELKNRYDADVKIMDATYSPVMLEITRLLKEIEKK